MYEYIDENIKKYREKIQKLYNNSRLRLSGKSKTTIEEIKKENDRLFKSLEGENSRFFDEEIESVYDEIKTQYKAKYEELSIQKDSSNAFLLAIGFSLAKFLEKYNETMLYIYNNEISRKRERYLESLIALSNLKSAKAIENMKRNARYWEHQLENTAIDVEREIKRNFFAKIGISFVRWVAYGDEKTCEHCKRLDGKVFPINAIPPRPHDNCRCDFEIATEKEFMENGEDN